MFLQTLSYIENHTKDCPWSVNNVTFGKINLIVGKNSTGKTRLLNIIKNVGLFFTGAKKLTGTQIIEFSFKDGKVLYNYKVETVNSKIQFESLVTGRRKLLSRSKDGIGSIYSQDKKEQLRFKIPETEMAIVTKRDEIQHPFLEAFFNWGDSIKSFDFGKTEGKDKLILVTNEKYLENVNFKNNDEIVLLYSKAFNDLGEPFKKQVIDDINEIGFEIEDIVISSVDEVQSDMISSKPVGLLIKERGHSHKVFSYAMSQGLYRALSLFIILRIAQHFCPPDLIVIDDIGEGLDFERSTSLIKRIYDLAKKANIQLIMSTNDRFTMNAVPLKHWNIMYRVGSECTVFNYKNSKEMFDEFSEYGLSNFDLFSSNYFLRKINQ